jgi:hypothetical protein
MTPRGKHLIEMRFALANNCSLPEAKRRLARQAALEANDAAARRSQCGTDYNRQHRADRAPKSLTESQGQTPPRWMMAD